MTTDTKTQSAWSLLNSPSVAAPLWTLALVIALWRDNTVMTVWAAIALGSQIERAFHD